MLPLEAHWTRSIWEKKQYGNMQIGKFWKVRPWGHMHCRTQTVPTRSLIQHTGHIAICHKDQEMSCIEHEMPREPDAAIERTLMEG